MGAGQTVDSAVDRSKETSCAVGAHCHSCVTVFTSRAGSAVSCTACRRGKPKVTLPAHCACGKRSKLIGGTICASTGTSCGSNFARAARNASAGIGGRIGTCRADLAHSPPNPGIEVSSCTANTGLGPSCADCARTARRALLGARGVGVSASGARSATNPIHSGSARRAEYACASHSPACIQVILQLASVNAGAIETQRPQVLDGSGLSIRR